MIVPCSEDHGPARPAKGCHLCHGTGTIQSETREQAIARLEASGDLDPGCAFCQREIYSQTQAMPQDVFCPRHKASSRCQSGKRAHCTCDTCF